MEQGLLSDRKDHQPRTFRTPRFERVPLGQWCRYRFLYGRPQQYAALSRILRSRSPDRFRPSLRSPETRQRRRPPSCLARAWAGARADGRLAADRRQDRRHGDAPLALRLGGRLPAPARPRSYRGSARRRHDCGSVNPHAVAYLDPNLGASTSALAADSIVLDVQGQLTTLGESQVARVNRDHPFTPLRNFRSAVEADSESFDGGVPSRLPRGRTTERPYGHGPARTTRAFRVSRDGGPRVAWPNCRQVARRARRAEARLTNPA